MAARDAAHMDSTEDELRAAIRRVRSGQVDDVHGELRRLADAAERVLEQRVVDSFVTTGVAKEQLEVGSINTVKHWLREGLLDGRIIHGRYYISERSIRDLLSSGNRLVAEEQRRRKELLALDEEDTLDLPAEEARDAIDRSRDVPGGTRP